MFSIKLAGPRIFSWIFPQSFLPVLAWKTTEKTIEISPDPLKYDAKHWAIVIKTKHLKSFIVRGFEWVEILG